MTIKINTENAQEVFGDEIKVEFTNHYNTVDFKTKEFNETLKGKIEKMLEIDPYRTSGRCKVKTNGRNVCRFEVIVDFNTMTATAESY